MSVAVNFNAECLMLLLRKAHMLSHTSYEAIIAKHFSFPNLIDRARRRDNLDARDTSSYICYCTDNIKKLHVFLNLAL